MAKKLPYGDNKRQDPVKRRTQFFNKKTGLYYKRDTATGRIIDVKTSNKEKFKGIILEKNK